MSQKHKKSITEVVHMTPTVYGIFHTSHTNYLRNSSVFKLLVTENHYQQNPSLDLDVWILMSSFRCINTDSLMQLRGGMDTFTVH